MKFSEIVEKFQNIEENKGKVIFARCGAFMVAIGKDAIFLNKVLKLNVSCLKSGVCKVGIPVTYTLKYANMLEDMGYGFTAYDYDHKTKEFKLKYSFNGTPNPEKARCLDCKNCKYYKEHGMLDNIDIFDILAQRERERQEKAEDHYE